ncbi:MAG: hypothetical protein IPH13_02250 [Planctomycetes bacterium]|nr:hypothetical protein [Planctomycetota bacterium]MCC7171203.1 hypothetical protein [Planctomycetota bacterium]
MFFAQSALILTTLALGAAQDSNPKPTPEAPTTPAPEKSKPSPRDPLEVAVPTFPNSSCPIMGKPSSMKLYADTEFGRIYICCKACIKKIARDPKTAYQAAYPTTKKANNATCPIMGDKNEDAKHTIVLQGYEVALCCEDCIAEARANPQVTLVKALDPKVKDLENSICPITGEEVAANAFCLIGDTLVRLSSPGCAESVKEDPEGTLEKATKAAAKKATEPGDSKGNGPAKTGEHDADHGGHEGHEAHGGRSHDG